MTYKCPTCHNPLTHIEGNNYKCTNLSCLGINLKIKIEEAYRDVYILNKETNKIEMVNKLCTVIDIKN